MQNCAHLHESLRRSACPQCGKSALLAPENPWRPFCCERCKLIDLGEWMSERCGIPDGEAAEPQAPPDSGRQDA